MVLIKDINHHKSINRCRILQAWECNCIKGYKGPLCDIPTNTTYTSGENDSHLQLTRSFHQNIENIAQMHAKNIKKFRKAVTKLGLDDLSLFIFPEQK